MMGTTTTTILRQYIHQKIVVVVVVVVVPAFFFRDAASQRRLARVELRRLSNGEAPPEQKFEIHATEDAEVRAQGANLGRRRGVRVEVHEPVLRGDDASLRLSERRRRGFDG